LPYTMTIMNQSAPEKIIVDLNGMIESSTSQPNGQTYTYPVTTSGGQGNSSGNQ